MELERWATMHGVGSAEYVGAEPSGHMEAALIAISSSMKLIWLSLIMSSVGDDGRVEGSVAAVADDALDP